MLSNTTDLTETIDTKENVAVAIRVRPLIARELSTGATNAWSIDGNTITQTSTDKFATMPSFTFDKVYDPKSGSHQLYAELARPLILSALDGFNVTIFAYGQTASGKTYTMTGAKEAPGIIPLTVKDIFSNTAQKTDDHEWVIKLNYVEIYNEEIRDLLNPSSGNLKIKEKWDRQIFIADATEVIVSSEKEVLSQLRLGDRYRSVGETNMNDHSSRSHAILAFTLEYHKIQPENGFSTPLKSSRINLVDLAGTERVSLTGAEGLRLKEGGKINQSLLTLSNVIQKLATKPHVREHIPYRDSKLTRILEPSLGGNSRTLIICNVTPSSVHVEETVSALKFANRAKNIKNEPRVNETLDVPVHDYEALILSLKTKLLQAQEHPPFLARYQQLIDALVKLSTRKRAADDDGEQVAAKKQKVSDESFTWMLRKVECLANDMEATEKRLLDVTSERNEMDASLRRHHLKMAQEKQALASLQTENTTRLTELKEQTAALSQLNETLHTEQSKRKDLRMEQASLQAKFTLLKEAHVRAVEGHHRSLKEHQQQMETLIAELSEQKKVADHAHGMMLGSETDLKNATRHFVTALKEIERKFHALATEKAELKKAIDVFRNEPSKEEEDLQVVTQLQVHLDVLNLSLLNTQKEKDQLACDLKETQEKLADATHHTVRLEKEQLELHARLESLSKAHETVVQQQATLQTCIDAVEKENATLKRERADNQSKQIQLRTLLEERKQAHDQLSKEHAHAQTELLSLTKVQQDTEMRLQEAHASVKLLETSNAELQSVNEQFETIRAELLSTIGNLNEKGSVLASQSEKNLGRINELQRQLEDKSNHVVEIQAQLESLSDEKRKLEEKLGNLAQEDLAHLSTLETLNRQCEDFKSLNVQLEGQLASAQASSTERSLQLELVQTQLQTCKEQLVVAQSEVQALSLTLEQHQSELRQWTSEREIILSQMVAMKDELRQEAENMSMRHALETTLRSQIETYHLKIQELEATRSEFQMRLEQQDLSLLQSREDREQLRRELSKICDAYEATAAKVELLKAQLLERDKAIASLEENIQALEKVQASHHVESTTQQLFQQSEEALQLTATETSPAFGSSADGANVNSTGSPHKMDTMQATERLLAVPTTISAMVENALQPPASFTESFERIQALRAELEDCKRDRKQLEQALIEERHQKEILIDAHEVKLEELEKAQCRIKDLELELDAQQLKSAEQILALNHRLHSQTEEITTAQNLFHETQREMNARMAEIRVLQSEKLQFELQCSESQAAMEELKRAHQQTEAERAKAHQEDIDAVAVLQGKLQSSQTKSSELVSEVESLRDSMKHVQSELERAEKAAAKAESVAKEKAVQVIRMENAHELALRTQQQSTEAVTFELLEKKGQLEAQIQKCMDSDAALQRLEKEYALQAEALSSKEHQLETLAVNYSGSNEKDLRRRSEAETMANELRSALEEKEKTAAALQTRYAKLQSEFKTAVVHFKEQESAHASLSQRHHDLENQHQLLLDAHEQLKKMFIEFKSQMSRSDPLPAKERRGATLKSDGLSKPKAKDTGSKQKYATSHVSKENLSPARHQNAATPIITASLRPSLSPVSKSDLLRSRRSVSKVSIPVSRAFPATLPLRESVPKPRPQCNQQ